MPGPVSLPAGYRLLVLGAVGSSNDEACREAERGAPEGALLWAESQSAGRGRRGRSWISPPGNLYLSLILRPGCAIRAAPQLSLLAALALAEAVEDTAPGLEVGCKWPNDLVVAGCKLAGILLESASGSEERIDWVVVGAGLNVAHHPELDAIESQRATSLAAEGVHPLPVLEDLITVFLHRFDAHYARWRENGFAPARTAWLARAAGLCEEIEVRLEGETLHGRFEGLTAGGELVLSLPAGTRRHLAAGEVRLLRAAKAGGGIDAARDR